jgi:hypothetical protein
MNATGLNEPPVPGPGTSPAGVRHVEGHGVSFGRLTAGRGEPVAGPDEDALTLAIEAAWWALERARRRAVGRVVLAVPPVAVNDNAVFLAGTGDPGGRRHRRVGNRRVGALPDAGGRR